VADPAVAETLDRPLPLGDDPIDRRIFYPLLLVGGLCILWGLKQLVDRKVPLLPFGEWFVGAAILHDAVLAPAVIVVGWLLGRGAPRRARVPVTAGLVVAGVILLYSIPALFTDGAQVADPSTLPNDEPRNVLLVLAAVGFVTGVGILVHRSRPVVPVAVASGPPVHADRRPPPGHRSVIVVLLALAVAAAADAVRRRR
jgi:hypothetical protein